MKKKFSKIFGVGLAVVMAVSLVMVAAPPQGSEVAATPDVTFRLSDQTFGTACWVTSGPAPHAGTYSVDLAYNTGMGAVYLEFVPEPGVTLADLKSITAASEWSFWHYMATGVVATPHLELRFTMPCGYDPASVVGHVDVTLMPLQAIAGTSAWVKQTVVATDKPAWVYYGNDPVDGTGFDNDPGSGMGVADLTGIEGLINGSAAMTAHGASASAWELTRVRMEVGWGGAARTCYIDDVTIDDTTYAVERGPEYWLDPDIAYNVKTAKETFTLMGPCGPVVVDADNTITWSVEKGCGDGNVTIVAGGIDGGVDGTNDITVRMNTKGDAHICAVYTPYMEDPVEVCAEKKWGEIYCTELTKGLLVDDEACVTESVEASFLWGDCIEIRQLPAENAKVDWWLMDIDALEAVQALEAELGDDPCDDDGGCGGYGLDFFEYDVDGDGTIQADEVFDSPRAAMLAIYDEFEFTPAEKADTYIMPDVTPPLPSDPTHTQTTTGVDGKTAVTVHIESPTSVILVTLTDYPIDKHGENTVCVQHETWIIVPPPEIEKLPNIAWAGEKVVVEWRLDPQYEGYWVAWYLEDPSVGTFEATDIGPGTEFPWPGFAYRDSAWSIASLAECGDYAEVEVILHSDKQGKSNVVAALLGVLSDAAPRVGQDVPYIIRQQGFLVFFLAFEEVELKNMSYPITNDDAWLDEGEDVSELGVNEHSYLRLRVKGFFEDPVMKSPRPEKPQDINGDGVTDIILPAGRWILPDDYPTLAYGKLLWDMMDTPIDDIVSWLDADASQVETLGLDDEVLALALPAGITEAGAYGKPACFESPLYDATLTTAQRWAAYLAAVRAFGPVIGPFSKLEPVNDDGTGWDINKPPQPDVLADGNPIDALRNEAGTAALTAGCRTTVVPDGRITVEDANMPPMEALFAITDGSGLLTAVNKADIYQRPETCVFGTLSVDGVVYTNPYYWQEIPASWKIPPMVSTGLAGYEWDSWDRATDPLLWGPFRFWDALKVWTADQLSAMGIFDLTVVPTILKTYTDNHGEAWVKFTQKDFDSSTIEAVATYPYLIGDHLPVVANPVVKMSENLKDIKLFVDDFDPCDDIRKLLYVFVRDYDGTPATCEAVEWTIDGPYGVFDALLANTCGACTNACYDDASFDWDCTDCFISADGKYAGNCTRAMTAAEMTYFVDEGVFASASAADDYAISGIVVLSSFCEDVDVPIIIYDCWEGTMLPQFEDKMVTGFCLCVPSGPTKGDFDDDGDIDFTDFVAFAAAYGSVSTDLNYDECADFDDDNDVDFTDFVAFAAVYGTGT